MPSSVQHPIAVFTPRGRDAVLAAQIVEREGAKASICETIGEVVSVLEATANAVVATEEAIAGGDARQLSDWIAEQEPWSDVPIVLLGNGGRATRSVKASARMIELGNVILLDRPLHIDALAGAIRSALKARARQFQIRDFSRTLETRIIERTRELETTRESLNQALDAADMGSWDLDLVSGVARRSLRHDQIFGYSELLTDWSRDIFLKHVVEQDRMRVASCFDQAAATGLLDVECQIKRTNGDVQWIAAKGRVHYANDGTPRRMTGIVADISARRQADAQAAQVLRLESVGQMTSGLAHDFNNMIQAVTAGFSMISKWSDDPRVTQVAQISLDAANRGSGLIKQMLAFARQQRLEVGPVDLSEFLISVEPLLRVAAPNADLVISEDGSLPKIATDPTLLEAALINFAVNARDAFTDGRGQITITATAIDPRECPTELNGRPAVKLDFADNGAGISPEVLSRVVEPFFTTKDIGKGSGLGLASANGFAHQSGGTMRVVSAVGKGTTITLYLPTTDAPRPGILHPSDGIGAPANPRLLLVDDDAMVRSMTAMQLEDLGYTVIEAASAAEANAHSDDLGRFVGVISDVSMPECDGPTMVAAMRKKRPDLKVLFITGNARYGQLLGERVLDKPFDAEQLARAVARMTG